VPQKQRTKVAILFWATRYNPLKLFIFRLSWCVAPSKPTPHQTSPKLLMAFVDNDVPMLLWLLGKQNILYPMKPFALIRWFHRIYYLSKYYQFIYLLLAILHNDENILSTYSLHFSNRICQIMVHKRNHLSVNHLSKNYSEQIWCHQPSTPWIESKEQKGRKKSI